MSNIMIQTARGFLPPPYMLSWSAWRALSALLAISLLALVAHAQQDTDARAAGEIVFVAGTASKQVSGGPLQVLSKGLKLAQGDMVRTDNEAYVYVRMADGGLLVVRPQSQLRIDRWRYNALQPELSEIKYTLESGVARYVSGRGSQAAKDKFRFNTSLAAIGVRGTDFTVLALPGLTQVSVRSGAVVVGSFGNGCRADALGPCHGDTALELLADSNNKLLQVTLGDRRPHFVDAATGSPDKARPPASGEPRADSGANVSAGVLLTEGAREATVADLAARPGGANALPLSIATWGRWRGLADSEAGAYVVHDVLKDRRLAAMNPYYVIGINPNATLEMPNAGVGHFKLVDHNGLLIEPLTGAIQETTASNGILQIDFGARRFQTSLDLQSPTLQTSIKSQGYIEADGKMASDPFVSTTAVKGLVGGKAGGEAIYIYNRSIDHGLEVSGVASWRK